MCEKPINSWMWDVLGECVKTKKQVTGVWFGIVSTIVWLFAQLPQIYINFKKKNPEGLSVGFVSLLICGDTCNLLGAIINDGMMTQITLASIFLVVDSLCLLQVLWYDYIKKKCMPSPVDSTPLIIGSLTAAAAAVSDSYRPPKLYGTLLGWLSFVVYASSRVPQIVKNYQHKKIINVSWVFFVSAIIGNTTYAISIFLHDSSWNYIWKQFPWLCGSLGLLVFDFIIMYQFFHYGTAATE